jgi:hypothetical protein
MFKYCSSFFLLLILVFINTTSVKAQDTLPQFSVEDKGGGRVVVSWKNPYPNLVQLAVQRSYDSVKRFSTLYSASSPELPANGFSDKIVPGLKVYYRVFYVMEGGAYFFTKSKRPGAATAVDGTTGSMAIDDRRDQLDEAMLQTLRRKKGDSLAFPADKKFFIKIADTLHASLLGHQLLQFRDSILLATKDTLYQLTEDTILLAVYVPPFAQRTSEFVFTDKDGYIVIKLLDADKKRYEVKFMEEDETPVLDIKTIKDSYLIIDKTNFYHGGWYKFELRENGRVKERNKVFLAKDFLP